MTPAMYIACSDPSRVRQFKEIYECATVKAKYPDSHIASKAVERLIDALEAEIQNAGSVLDMCLLTEDGPQVATSARAFATRICVGTSAARPPWLRVSR
ncbi:MULTISPECIES: hypothetical protein [Mesorhizobium]|uniref:Uncharacterized protein n=2 Tax=Mesorhizobium TaxID=68287 RepID=A0AB38TKV2_9HYPH|nr:MULTISPECIES: hypothetical protein [Mesorhizobium]RUY52331.1 hypothetical protein EN981_11055 [Mesorhizobium sp. M7A.F.Ca.CA.001.13.2.1]RUY63861.1 hypothetical protein EN965_22245 [Mesorhizobium sp. M7A.F.Ca.CA.001.05.1.1]RVA75693.1 hypothetical protein EN914_23980 [Mesorhizobium sp. M7A.F.Ca.CA.001.08.2.1]MDF3218187.1 hypothetical protein [Mesorhizobium ciceri]RUY67486.1 hypothetical protein EN980_17120 [Mesorhizobium sp. M7A.F.Ca.CA.001.13.1.1]